MGIFRATLEFNPAFDKRRDMIQAGGSIQQFIDATVLKGVSPYMPFREGTAERSGTLHTQIGSGMVVWKTPYIRYIYFGKSRSGGPLVYDTSRHPKAGALWCEVYKQNHKRELEGMVQRRVIQQWENTR
jgi:hypothetical protein